jgi:hypothetical protein
MDKDFLQNNIDRSVDYQKEYYKYNIGIATALLAFTTSFPPSLTRMDARALMFVAWVGLGAAILAGVRTHYLWAKFFISWRDFDNKDRVEEGKVVRKAITSRRRFFEKVQILGLLTGVAGVVLFTSINLGNLALKEVKSGALDSKAQTLEPPSPKKTGP